MHNWHMYAVRAPQWGADSLLDIFTSRSEALYAADVFEDEYKHQAFVYSIWHIPLPFGGALRWSVIVKRTSAAKIAG